MKEIVVLWWGAGAEGTDEHEHVARGGVRVEASFDQVYRIVGREPDEALAVSEARSTKPVAVRGPVFAYPLSSLPDIVGCGLRLADPRDQVWLVSPDGAASRVEVSQADIKFHPSRESSK